MYLAGTPNYGWGSDTLPARTLLVLSMIEALTQATGILSNQSGSMTHSRHSEKVASVLSFSELALTPAQALQPKLLVPINTSHRLPIALQV